MQKTFENVFFTRTASAGSDRLALDIHKNEYFGCEVEDFIETHLSLPHGTFSSERSAFV